MPTEVVAEQFRAGESTKMIADLFDLTAAQVEQALRFVLSSAGVDESALGLGELLAGTRRRWHLRWSSHLPEIPLGTIDVGWMPIMAERNWVAVRRSHRIHTWPLEVCVFSEVGLRTVWLGGKKDRHGLTPAARPRYPPLAGA